MDCQPDSDTCKARKSSVTKPMKQYHDKKAKKTEIYEDLRAKAKRKREELQNKHHKFFASAKAKKKL
jgi:hypothetical protein